MLYSKDTGVTEVRTQAEGAAPVRVQLKRTKGWRMPPNTVKVDRTTKWGNPFVVEEPDALTKMLGGRWYVWTCGLDAGEFVERCVNANVIEDYHSYGWDRGSAIDIATRKFKTLAAPFLPVAELRGKNLACWCKPGAPCHADVLLELANSDPERTKVVSQASGQDRVEPSNPSNLAAGGEP